MEMQEHIELLKNYGLKWENSYEDIDFWRKIYLTFPQSSHTGEIWTKMEDCAAELAAEKIAGLSTHPMQIEDKDVFLQQIRLKEDKNSYCKYLLQSTKIGYKKYKNELRMYLYFDTEHSLEELTVNQAKRKGEILKDIMNSFSEEDKMKMVFDSSHKTDEINSMLIKLNLKLMGQLERALALSSFNAEFKAISIKKINESAIEKVKC